MREIKFRAWDKWNKRFEDHTHRVSVKLNGDIYNSEYGDDQNDRYVVQQYTGLHDRKGVEIYEGDVLTDGRERGCVLWFKYNCEFVLHYQDHIEEEDLDPGCDVDENYGWVELKVIGNIHQNPELL